MKISVSRCFIITMSTMACIILVESQFSHTPNSRATHQQQNQPEFIIPFGSLSSSSSSASSSFTDAAESPFPNHTTIPAGLRFSCFNREPGYYANPLADCQVYHHCLPDGRAYTFMCGIGTIFNQRNFICDHWYNYNCADAENDYKFNSNLNVIAVEEAVADDVQPPPSNELQLAPNRNSLIDHGRS